MLVGRIKAATGKAMNTEYGAGCLDARPDVVAAILGGNWVPPGAQN